MGWLCGRDIHRALRPRPQAGLSGGVARRTVGRSEHTARWSTHGMSVDRRPSGSPASVRCRGTRQWEPSGVGAGALPWGRKGARPPAAAGGSRWGVARGVAARTAGCWQAPTRACPRTASQSAVCRATRRAPCQAQTGLPCRAVARRRGRTWGLRHTPPPVRAADGPVRRACQGRARAGGLPDMTSGTPRAPPAWCAGRGALLTARRAQRLGYSVSHAQRVGRRSGGGRGRRGCAGVRGPASAVA